MLTLSDLVGNGSVSPDGAQVLREIGGGGHSFLVYARPRNAGKTTLTEAIVAAAPADLPRRAFLGTEQEVETLSTSRSRGYVQVAEIGHRGRPGYLTGEEVQRAFGLIHAGYALASSLHADTVEEVFEVLQRNGVQAGTAAAVRYLVKIQVLGDPDNSSTPRVVERIDEVTSGAPSFSTLYESVRTA